MSTAVAKRPALKNVESTLAWEVWQNPDKSCPMELCFERPWPTPLARRSRQTTFGSCAASDGR